jgi:hypothetical protein
VNFDLYQKLAPDHQPRWDLQSTIRELRDGLAAMDFNDPNFRESQFIRLRTLSQLREQRLLNDDLEWDWSQGEYAKSLSAVPCLH